jgi:hypothetical protein
MEPLLDMQAELDSAKTTISRLEAEAEQKSKKLDGDLADMKEMLRMALVRCWAVSELVDSGADAN